MTAKYLHIGIPITNKKPGMVYNEGLRLWMGKPDDHDFKIEYLKFEEGGPFPEIMHKNPHVAYEVDDAGPYLAEADQVIFGPAETPDGYRMAFIIKDDAIIELMEKKP
ncbi:MAG: hypothetical protein LBP33_04290 [Candidatus Adiutrix sp.]|jgi:hypothetical protein|nr:hypothetical protein [Candidatus Adiutrix sp.]